MQTELQDHQVGNVGSVECLQLPLGLATAYVRLLQDVLWGPWRLINYAQALELYGWSEFQLRGFSIPIGSAKQADSRTSKVRVLHTNRS